MGGNDTTIGLPFELRDKIKSMKIIDDETYPSVLRRIIEEAEKVPVLEARIKELERKS
jgi:hypothetical protein